MSSRFDLRSIQSDSVDLPSVSEFQSLERIPSLQDLQGDRPDLPSLRSFQSNEKLERTASLKILQVCSFRAETNYNIKHGKYQK